MHVLSGRAGVTQLPVQTVMFKRYSCLTIFATQDRGWFASTNEGVLTVFCAEHFFHGWQQTKHPRNCSTNSTVDNSSGTPSF